MKVGLTENFISRFLGRIGNRKRRDLSREKKDDGLKYKQLFYLMVDGFVIVDMSGKITDANDSYCQMVGYELEELIRLTYLDLTPEKWHDTEMNIVSNQILHQGHSAVYEKEYKRKDGTIFPVELRTCLITDDQGRPAGMWAIVRDITERKNVEMRMRESGERYRSIINSSLTAILLYTLDDQDRLIFQVANPVADRILGVDHSKLCGLTLEEAFPNLAGTNIPVMYRQIALGVAPPQSFEIYYKDERFSGYYFVHVYRTGNRSITVDFIDISERKKVELELKRSEIEYRDTLNSLPDWIHVIDHQLNTVMFNASMADAMTFSGAGNNKVGHSLEVNSPFTNDQDIMMIRKVFQTGQIETYTQKINYLSREMFTENTVVPIWKDGFVAKVIFIRRDRSKEKEIEELKQRNTDQKEMLLREIHHRVKNNLSIVSSLLTFQMMENTNPAIRRSMTDIQTRIRVMALIHEHLYRSENLDRIPLATYIESLIQMIISTFSGIRINIIYDLDAIESNIETALPVGLIINELVTNAIKYAFPERHDGRITVTLKMNPESNCIVTVGDDGIGLPEKITTDSSSSLGLYIVSLLTEQLEGNFSIDRSQGTLFTIRFKNYVRKPANLTNSSD